MNENHGFTGMRQHIAEDGTVTFIDPGTRKTKKNRHRHTKDGAPKKLRGIPKEHLEVIVESSQLIGVEGSGSGA